MEPACTATKKCADGTKLDRQKECGRSRAQPERNELEKQKRLDGTAQKSAFLQLERERVQATHVVRSTSKAQSATDHEDRTKHVLSPSVIHRKGVETQPNVGRPYFGGGGQGEKTK